MNCLKARYPDKKTALTMANSITQHPRKLKKGQMRRRDRVRALRAYPCPDCNGWHLSSKV